MTSDRRDQRGRDDEPARPSRRPDRTSLDDVFGDVLPDTTSDERGPAPDRRATDDWYLENRPPHHGG
ncbi:hypothetical protein [Prauserella muralis]|uniref:Uncharacterized protein n=1 Tax=Prauserella muralis TaxID=588067 RepID=A0A2V4B6W7_9PSEU|nr:hypothetical protein [Prauserella muralis]PXY30876.1 hypothetical protein BAY60_00050 [Prauserella muralis]TWE14883.1 hypothetical protein FHX69_7043 [Prauserella muralis]